MRIARHYLIKGRVQGVGFRFFAQDAARREGIHGSVRNTELGTVEVEAEGEQEALERFERHLRNGPPHARVEAVQVTDAAATGRDTGFNIR